MSLFALVDPNNRVVDLSATEFPVNAALRWIDATNAYPVPVAGWNYLSGVFVAPVITVMPTVPVTQISPLQFMARFTADETSAIQTAAMSNVTLFGWLLQCAAASYIDLTDPQTRAGLDALVQAGLLMQSREDIILTP